MCSIGKRAGIWYQATGWFESEDSTPSGRDPNRSTLVAADRHIYFARRYQRATFHWFANATALGEIRRVLKPHSRLGLIWNRMDYGRRWLSEIQLLIDR